MSSEPHLQASRNFSMAALRELLKAQDCLKMAVALLIDSATADEQLVEPPIGATSQEKPQ